MQQENEQSSNVDTTPATEDAGRQTDTAKQPVPADSQADGDATEGLPSTSDAAADKTASDLKEGSSD